MTVYRAPVRMSIEGRIDGGDVDNHRIYLYQGKKYRIHVSCRNGRADLDLAIYDDRDEILGVDHESSVDAAIVLTVGRTQLFKLAASSASGSSAYTMTVTEQ